MAAEEQRLERWLRRREINLTRSELAQALREEAMRARAEARRTRQLRRESDREEAWRLRRLRKLDTLARKAIASPERVDLALFSRDKYLQPMDEDVFSDPTFDAVCERLDAEEREKKAVSADWNSHVNQHERPFFLTADRPTEIANQANGLRHKMSGRHRGRNARSAAARGKRSSRSQPKASR